MFDIRNKLLLLLVGKLGQDNTACKVNGEISKSRLDNDVNLAKLFINE
jgi:hypothetical protein